MDPLATIKALADVGTAALEEAKQHEALKNSPTMIQAHVLESMQAEIDTQRSQIANEDLEAYRLAVSATPGQS